MPGFVLNTPSRLPWLAQCSATAKSTSGKLIIIGSESTEEETRMIKVMEMLL